ncbi:MAG TPA: hypothetical protein VFC74_03400 [Oscillospiraceae bacterium]|nr:hypothetical protein [Oscillospiraceae bacterium]
MDIVLGYRKRKAAATASAEELNTTADARELEQAEEDKGLEAGKDTVEPVEEALTSTPVSKEEQAENLPAEGARETVKAKLNPAKITEIEKAAAVSAVSPQKTIVKKILSEALSSKKPTLPNLPKNPFDIPDENNNPASTVNDDSLLLLLILILLKTRK